jgi:hypothetical protein
MPALPQDRRAVSSAPCSPVRRVRGEKIMESFFLMEEKHAIGVQNFHEKMGSGEGGTRVRL